MKLQEDDDGIAAFVLIALASLALLCFLLAGLSIREMRLGTMTDPPPTSPLLRALSASANPTLPR